jgi:methyl-accepting chemotaxis protein PixJ
MKNTPATNHFSPSQPVNFSWWQDRSIRFKTTVMAIAIGTIPTITLSFIAYNYTARSIQQETVAAKKTFVGELQNQVNSFMFERYGDIQVMANLDVFSNPEIRNLVTAEAKSAMLQKIHDTYQVYDSIAVFDTKGEPIAQTKGKPLDNHLNRSYIQAALEADAAVISEPIVSKSSGTFSVYTAAPIHDRATKELIGFVRARIPVEGFKELLKDYSTNGNKYYLLDSTGNVFLGSEGESRQTVNASQVFSNIEELLTKSEIDTTIATNLKTQTKQLVAFAPPEKLKNSTELNWQAIIATDSQLVFASQRQLRNIFILGTGVVALAVGVIAYSVVNRAIRPILSVADAVAAIGQGDLDTRVQLSGTDELARLGNNINLMASQLNDFFEKQSFLVRQAELLKNLTLKFSVAFNPEEIINAAVAESREILNSDRSLYYQFDDSWQGTIVVESLLSGFTSCLRAKIHDPCFAEQYIEEYRQGKVLAIDDLQKANLTDSHLKQLEPFAIKASLIAPVIVQDRLHGLLIVHQCSTPREWQPHEIELVTQLAHQVGFALTRLEFTQQQQQAQTREKQAKEAIQSRALDLLKEVYEVSAGDLTIRARVTEDEIGTIADSYNSTIASLQKLVNRVKTATKEVKITTESNQLAVRQMARETILQADEIGETLKQIQQMSESIDTVSLNAARADDFAKVANETIAAGDRTMDYTVNEINAIQTTVTQTAAKVMQLGDSSREISQAVNLIGRFAAQTHLLALKASIEAARAGDRGKGFAVIADEVRSLASQSAEATAQIDNLVAKIQLETNDVVEAMNVGTQQVAKGTQLVQQTRESLDRVTAASQEISNLVRAIAEAANRQSQTSQNVSNTITNVAEIAQNHAQSATEVSASIQQLSAVAEKLQAGISEFKT